MPATPATSATAVPALPATLGLGPVHLTVKDVDRSVAWYRESLGLRIHRHDASEAALGDGTTDVIVLHEDPLTRPAGRHAGLYHYALLFPSREELARVGRRIAATRAPIQGLSDHLTHEAIYLPDPDGIGIELAADRPREEWPTPQRAYGAGPQPLDTDALFGTIAGEELSETVGAGLKMGHVHLHVGDVEEALGFYQGVLGFDLIANIGTAAFVSAGGYHHHVGMNVWKGEGVGPAPEHAAGLRHWTIELDGAAEVARLRSQVVAAGREAADVPGGFAVRDPWRIEVHVVVRRAA